ncbi:MAG: glycoside hydrolase family protein [Anaerolineae bacterium]
MIYQPALGSIWDPSVLWQGGRYYAVMMYNPDGPDGLKATCGLISHSDDGVHWHEGWQVCPEPLTPYGGKFFKAFIGRIGNRFVMNHGVLQPNGWQDTLRYYESQDLREWTYICSNQPDPQWYMPTGRWDHMYTLPKDEENPAAGYWGYPVATTRPELLRGCGLMETHDGRSWTILPPPVFDWGDVQPQDLEIGGVERLDGKYLMMGGTCDYVSDGYSMYTLIADDPRGPFRPDSEAFRLCGTSSRVGRLGVSLLAAWCRGEGNEKLISNYVEVPSGIWMLPLRKPVFDDGHLRLGWWKKNDLMKGPELDLPAAIYALGASGPHRQLTWLDTAFDISAGVVIEGVLRAEARAEGAAVGFALSETRSRSIEIRLGIGEPAERSTRIGRYNDVTGFNVLDMTGRGCATVTGIGNGSKHAFRLLLRYDMFELYLDDLLVQTYTYQPEGGKVGFLVDGAQAAFENIRAWKMDL